MKILFFTPRFYPSIGGVQKHIVELSQLLKDRFQITIVTEQHINGLKTKEIVNQIPVYRIPTASSSEKGKKWKIWSWLWSNRDLIANADLIHVHDVSYWFFPFRFLYPSKRIFITYHGYEGSRPPKRNAIVQRKIGEWLSQGTICIGDFMHKWYYAKPKVVSYGAANLQAQPLPKNYSAIFLGRLDDDIGIMTYLDALRLQIRPIKLEVYGDGPLRKKAEEFVKKHNLPVTFKGIQADGEKYLAKKRFAFVSRYLSILEAMQTKRLVFANYNNEIKEDYLRCHPEAKNMVIFHSPDQLAEKLEYYTKNPHEEVKKIKSCYSWGKSQTWQKLANQYLSLWEIK